MSQSPNEREQARGNPTPVNEVSFWLDYGLPRMFVRCFKSRTDERLVIYLAKQPNQPRPAKLPDEYIELLPESELPHLIDTGVKPEDEVIPK